MRDANELTHDFASRMANAVESYEKALTAVERGKASLLARTVEAAVARAVADPGATAKVVSRWLAESVKADKCASTLAAYRSAIVWRLDSATLAGLRATVPADVTGEEFHVAVAKAAEGLGDVWADYKRRDKAEPEAKPATEAGASAPAEPAKPAFNAVLDAETRAAVAINELIGMGDSEEAREALARLVAKLVEAEALLKAA